MSSVGRSSSASGPVVQAYLLGVLDFEVCLTLQQRLVYEISGRGDGQMALLLCEHAPLVTVGRQGSWSHLSPALHAGELPEPGKTTRTSDGPIPVKWVNRGGGCILHLPGQLAVYPIVPLFWYNYRVGDYVTRLQAGIASAIAELGIACETRPGSPDVWSPQLPVDPPSDARSSVAQTSVSVAQTSAAQTGGTRSSGPDQLAALGVAVKSWTSYFGAYINVCPTLYPYRLVRSDPQGLATMSSLSVERGQPVRMSRARETLLRHLTHSLGGARTLTYTGHPLLESLKRRHEAARVG